MSSDYRFWGKVDVGDSEECWPWLGSRNGDGYGRFWDKDKLVRAHSFALEEFGVPVNQKQVLHHCDNPPCCNPSHLFLGDPLINTRDMIAKGRRASCEKENNGNARLTNDDVAVIRERIQDGENYKDISEDYPVGRSAIGEIGRGRNWA